MSIFCKYIDASWEANMIMSGLEEDIDKRYNTWTPQDILALKRIIRNHRYQNKKKKMLYRGTTTVSPLLENRTNQEVLERFDRREPIQNLSLLSTSRDRNIAKEFATKTGFIHVFHILPGVHLIDLSTIQCKDTRIQQALEREKEILIAPRQLLVPLKKYGNNLHWTVKSFTFQDNS